MSDSLAASGVTVELDAARQVRGVRFDSLSDELRAPDALVRALHRAYLDAISAQLEGSRGERRRDPGERPVALAERTPAPSSSSRFGSTPFEELTAFWAAHPDPQTSSAGERPTGVSRNDCVHVRLHATDHFADIDVDPGWLRSARVDAVAAAVLQAFEDAYTKRDHT